MDLTAGMQFQTYPRREQGSLRGLAKIDNEPVAEARIERPSEELQTRVTGTGAGVTPEPAYQHMIPGEQGRFPLHSTPAKVSWALATGEGQRRAAPHMLLSLMSEHYGIKPVADENLTEAGSRMSRSAHRRGLIDPHPQNPKMSANIDRIYSPGESVMPSLRYADRDASYYAAHSHSFSPQEVSRAKQRIFPGKQKPPAHLNQEQLRML